MVTPSQNLIYMYVIYKINFPNEKVYVGQTNNLKKRILEHLGEARRGKDSKVYRAMRKYNITKENFEILENDIASNELADSREVYWINFYNSYKNGYNSTIGGDVGNGGMFKGENSPRAVLTNEDVLHIRMLKSEMKYSRSEIYNKYKEIISISGFCKIWHYEHYSEIAPELNTKEVQLFYKHYKVKGSKNKKCIFTEEDIIKIREAYYIDVISSKELSELYSCGESTISRIVSGKTYSDIPMPKPSILYRRKNHLFEKSEIDQFIETFISSKLNIKNFWDSIKDDMQNVFGGFSESQFRVFINKELENRGFRYKTNNKWNFEIIHIN